MTADPSVSDHGDVGLDSPVDPNAAHRPGHVASGGWSSDTFLLCLSRTVITNKALLLSVVMVTCCGEDWVHHSDISAHLSGPDGSSRPGQSLAGSASGSSPSAGQGNTDIH